MTRLKPKSAIMISASSFFVRKIRFSGLRSTWFCKSGLVGVMPENEIYVTSVDDTTIVDVLDGLHNGSNEFGGIAGRRKTQIGSYVTVGTYAS